MLIVECRRAFFVCLAVLLNFVFIVSGDELLFVHALWRHGDRTPVRTIPTDQRNTVDKWINGLGQLTVRGMEQGFKLGKEMKRRYVDELNLLDKNFDADTIYIRSTGYNRTLMTAYSMLAGMFPPTQGEIPGAWWNNMRWQPIPVHSRPREYDPMLWMNYPCPMYRKIYYESLAKSEEVQTIQLENQDLLARLSTSTGFKKLNLGNIWQLWDPLNVMRIYPETNPWPSYINESVFETLSEMYHMDSRYLHHDERIARLRGGILLKDIVGRMQAASKGTVGRLKFYGYSAHDMTVNALMEALRIQQGDVAGYTSCLTIELWKKDNGVFVVKTQFKGNSTAPLASQELTPSDCPSYECPLARFTQRSEPFMLSEDEFEEDCKTTTAAGTKPQSGSSAQLDAQAQAGRSKDVAIIALAIICAILLIALFLVLVWVWKLRSSKLIKYDLSSLIANSCYRQGTYSTVV